MDPVAVGLVVFLVPSGDDSKAVGDEETAKGGLGVVGEIVPGEDACGGVSSTAS